MAPSQKKFLIISFIVLLMLFQPFYTVSPSYYNVPDLPYSFDDSLISRIIFTGFDQSLMNTLLLPNGLLEANVNYYNSFPQSYTEKTFFIKHAFELASSSFDNALFEFLSSSAIPDTLTDDDETSNRYRRIYPREFNYTGRFISANDTINWLSQNYNTYFSTRPIPGYTLILANMTRLDDQNYPNHWYNESYIDSDSNAVIKKNYMTGYGVKDRIYYLDLSSDSYYLQDANENSTLQDMKFLYDFSTQYGRRRLAEYLAEWIYEIERNLWIQDPIYAPFNPVGDLQTGIQYSFEILVICNLTGYDIEDLHWTVDENQILRAIKELQPWMKTDILVKFVQLSDLPRLDSIIHQSLVPWGDFKTLTNSKYAIDLIPIYEELYRLSYDYMSQNITTSNFYNIHFQTFAFLFDDAMFGIPEKAQLEPAILGIALRDSINRPLTIISQDFKYLYGNNRSNPQKFHGLTHTIIHETGHQLSLMHPFQFGEVGNFIDDVMAYYPYSSRFSVFSIDNVQRAQIDMLLKRGKSLITEMAENAVRKVYDQDLNNFFQAIIASYYDIKEKYDAMLYREAYILAIELYLTLLAFDRELINIQDKREYTEMNPIFFLGMLVFLTLGLHYYVKYRNLIKNPERRLLLNKKTVDKLEKRSKDLIIASRQAAAEKVDTIISKENKDSN